MSDGSSTRHAAPSHIRSTGQASFVLGISGLTLGGCWVILVVLLPDVVDLIGPLKERPYVVAGAVGVVCGLLAVILGAVGWKGARTRALTTSVPVAGCVLGIVAIVLGLAVAAMDVLNVLVR